MNLSKPAWASCCKNILNKNYVFPSEWVTATATAIASLPPRLCLRQRSGWCRVFPEQERWAALHLLSHFLSSCLHFHFLLTFVSLQHYMNALSVQRPCIQGKSYYPGAQNTCTCVSALLLKNGGRLMFRLSLICVVILNFTILRLVLTSKFCSQEYKFTLFLSVPTLPRNPLSPHDSAEGKKKKNSSKEAWNEKKGVGECLLCHVCGGGRQLPWSRPALYRWQPSEKYLHIGADGWTDCLFVPWQIHSTCVTAVDPSPRRRGEDEIGRREGNEGAPADNAVSLFITAHWNRHWPPVSLSLRRKPPLFLGEVDVEDLPC